MQKRYISLIIIFSPILFVYVLSGFIFFAELPYQFFGHFGYERPYDYTCNNFVDSDGNIYQNFINITQLNNGEIFYKQCDGRFGFILPMFLFYFIPISLVGIILALIHRRRMMKENG